jgi:hypothetical protein
MKLLVIDTNINDKLGHYTKTEDKESYVKEIKKLKLNIAFLP